MNPRKKIDGHEQSEGTGRYKFEDQQDSRNNNEDVQKQNAESRRDISEIDQQEGDMNNGAVGGNFDTSDQEENY